MTKKANILELKKANNDLVSREVGISLELKQDDSDDQYYRFEAYGAAYGNIDNCNDVVVAGAFKESVALAPPVILWQHDRHEPIGMPELITEDQKGLKLGVIMPKDDTFVSGRVMPQLRIKSIKAMSIGYIVQDFFIKDDIRYITKAMLKEVSLVTFPANEQAQVTAVKSQEQTMLDIDTLKNLTKRELETKLSDSGLFSKKASVMIASSMPLSGELSGGDGDEVQLPESLKALEAKYSPEPLEDRLVNIFNKY